MTRTQVSPAASIEREDAQPDEKKVKTRRPPNTAFRQQRLKAWQPILTPKSVLPLFFAVGVIFAPIGGLLLWASDKVQEISIDYTNCGTQATDEFGAITDGTVTSHFSSSNSSVNVMWRTYTQNVTYGEESNTHPTTFCELQFDLPNDIGPPVLLYYTLTKFHQNHRRYVKSIDQLQLEGHYRDNGSISGSYCDPLSLDENGFAYYPCGLIANSLFNDSFTSPYLLNVAGGSSDNSTYYMTNEGIAWSSDASLYGQSPYSPDQVVPPVNWRKRWPKYDNDKYQMPDLKTWEEFQVWMRTAGLPTFSKLARRNDTLAMRAGTYRIRIQDDFPVTEYGGTKKILISTRTIMGGKNPYLGIAYIVVGGICVILGAVFLAMHLIRPRKLGDHTYLTWNNEPTAATTATGRSLRPNDGA